jgi:hypothetical protein
MTAALSSGGKIAVTVEVSRKLTVNVRLSFSNANRQLMRAHRWISSVAQFRRE